MEINIVTEKFYSYLIQIKGYSKDTIRRFKNVIPLYCKLSGISCVEDISPENVRSLFFNGRTVRKWSANTFHVYHKSLSVFFRWCQHQGYLTFNPIKDIETPAIEERLPKKLTKQDALRLLEIIYNYPYPENFQRYRNHALFATFIFAGLRKSELLNLKFSDVDLENLTLFVKLGKGAKDRIIPICFSLAESLKRYMLERKRRGITCPEFFVSSNGNFGFTDHGLNHSLIIIRKAFGNKFTIHQLRHTFATLMLEGGCDIYSLSKMMGHKQITTTTIYLSASVEHLRAQIIKHPLDEQV